MQKRTRLSVKLALSAVSLLSALAVLEGSVRLWDWFSGTPHSAWRTEIEIREVVSAMTDALPNTGTGIEAESSKPTASTENPSNGRRNRKKIRYRLHPYIGFDVDAGLALTERTVAFFEQNDPDRPYVIFMTGGSVAALFGGNMEAGIGRLIERMKADPAFEGRKIKLVRLAVPGFKQPQQFLQLAYLLSRGCEPDMVLNLDGLNEVRTGFNNANRGLQPTWPSLGHWTSATSTNPNENDSVSLDLLVEMRALQQDAQEEAQVALRRHYPYSAILSKWTLSSLTRSRSRWAGIQRAFVDRQVALRREGQDHAFGKPPTKAGAVQASVRCWFESSLAMHQLCSARGIRYVHVLQPTLHDEGSKIISDEERRKGVGDKGFHVAVVEGYPLLREGMQELRSLGVEALDLSLAFEGIEETVYFDTCHFGALGCRVLSDQMADAMGVDPIEGR
jgi:hypothetical protein